MSRLDELPPDQRAALSLLLGQRKSYAEVATLLAIEERSVHDRAHAALALLAPRQARELAAERREEIGDYLLGQQPGVGDRLAARAYLSESEPARDWATAISGELAPLSSAPLPEIPDGSSPAPARGSPG
ncbi:MAG: Sigma-70 region 4 type 2, partial [Solirubrobacterales bacterium]|nr:Sigma-70 region 4 type 2 [Solirubrobacterales bacterium]